jgi:hypothetical protein
MHGSKIIYRVSPIIKEPKKKATVMFPCAGLQGWRCSIFDGLRLVLDTLQAPTYHSSKFAGKGMGYDVTG